MSRRKVPATMFTHLGPMPVLFVDRVDEANNRGEVNLEQRVIRIQSGHADATTWQTLGHELMHAIVSDSGGDALLDEDRLEFVCDAFGTWFAAAIASGSVVVR